MTTFKMELNRIIQTSIIWIAMLLTSLSTAQTPLHITDLECYNDFEDEMFCSWKVKSNSICGEDFQLKYTDFENNTQYCQDLRNEHHGDTRWPNKCICTINGLFFPVFSSYYVEVQSHGASVGKKTMPVESTVKPRAPSNVRVDIGETDIGEVHWQTNYETSFIRTRFCFEVEFICKQDNTRPLRKKITQVEPRFKFSKQQLKRGYDYMVRVRTKLSELQELTGIWSEWSELNPKAEWRNDYALSVQELKSVIIPVSCVLLLVIILSSYVCVSRCKSKWWNNIPDPAKSNLAQLLLIPKHQFKLDGKTSAKTNRKYFIRSKQKDKNSKHVQLTQKQNIKDFFKVNSELKKNIFEPEKEDIESCFEIHPKIDDTNNPFQEDALEDRNEAPLLGMDFSIGRMFCDILSDSSAQKMDAFEIFNLANAFDNFACPSLMDLYNKDETRLVSPESGYHSYDCDNSPVDFPLQLYQPNTINFDEYNQKDFSPYAPPFSFDGNSSGVGKEVTFMNSGYNSFDRALAGDKLDSNVDTVEPELPSKFCMNASSQYRFFNWVKTNNTFYYNTRYCLVPSQCKVHNHGIHSGHVSTPEVSAYQSFHQAVQESDKTGNTSYPLAGSGYKPFESLLEPNTTSLNSNGYKPKMDDQYLFRESAQNNEQLPEKDQVDNATHHVDESKIYGKTVDFAEFLQNDIPFALTFDICGHLKNFRNLHGNKVTHSGLTCGRVPIHHALFPCHLDDATFIHDHLSIKEGLPAPDLLPLKFQNMPYFLPFYQLSLTSNNQTSNHLLLQQNNLDKEGNLYMKIAL